MVGIKSKKSFFSCCFAFLISIVLGTVAFSSCGVKDSVKATSDFGPDADYFIGLQKLEDGNENEARTKFLHCIKKGSLYCAKRSAQTLTTFGSVQQKNAASLDLVKAYPDDEESLLVAARCLYDSNEIHKVILITQNLNPAQADNALLKIRFDAMKKRGDSLLLNELFTWYTNRQISAQHYQFYNDYAEDFSDDTDFRNTVIRFRIRVYEKSYTSAAKLVNYIEENLQSGKIPLFPQLASDIGKALFYSTSDYLQTAHFLEDYAQTYEGTALEFYFWFYTARSYEKAANYQKAYSIYQLAVQSALEPSQKDNALWYLMENQLRLSLKDSVDALDEYAPLFDDPEYYDDHFDKLLTSLLHSTNKKLILQAYKKIKPYATKETCAKYAYVYARLLQEGIVKADNSDAVAFGKGASDVGNVSRGSGNDSKEALMRGLFEDALDCGSSVYYKIMAAYRLNYSDSELASHLYKNSTLHQKNNKEAETLLQGYARYGFAEKIYSEWLRFPKDEISTDTALLLSEFLLKCAAQNPEYYVQSLRIAAKAAGCSERPLSFEEIKLLYPKNYSDYIDTFSQKYDITNSTVYALVRGESFFDSKVSSHAGAIGLTQLMPLTAKDIARKLKAEEYSLLDPQTNLEFGAFYLAEMYRRCDNSMLLAFFSYNAGITKVRRWLQTSIAEFGRKGDLSGDLLLETLPYEETREYGRKLVGASAMYELLYSENNVDSYKKMVESLVY
ncbi:MAG: lytic transglycosylase domain-containing protein [Treponema sp.]|nr:lytic transglycosylase domain-containing protein [Treponema sp.]